MVRVITLYDNPFSPFARKVRMVLAHKGLPYARIDALAHEHQAALRAVNPRGEVPVLVDGPVVVVNSADIVAYLDHRHPAVPVLPPDPARRVEARAWERLADGVLDAIVHDISIWTWPTHRRTDEPPAGLIEAGRHDVMAVFDRLEHALAPDGFLCGALSVADFALWPHLSALRALGIVASEQQHPKLAAWMRRLRALAVVAGDVDDVRRMASARFGTGPSPYESERIVWRGERLEWLFHRGFHAWWAAELAAGRATIPPPF